MSKVIKTPFAANGDKKAIATSVQTNGEVSYPEGFTKKYEEDLDTDPTALEIQRGTMNQLFNEIHSILQNLQSKGAEDFDSDVTYQKGAMVWSNGELYISQKANNKGVLTDPSSWKSMTSLLASSGGKIMLGPRYDWKQRGGNEKQGYVLVTWADFGGSNYWTYHRPLYYWDDGKWILTPIGTV